MKHSTSTEPEIIISFDDLTMGQKYGLSGIAVIFLIETVLLANFGLLGEVFKLFLHPATHYTVGYVINFFNTLTIYLWILMGGLMFYQGFAILTLEGNRLQSLSDTFYVLTLLVIFLSVMFLVTALSRDGVSIEFLVILNYLTVLSWIAVLPAGIFAISGQIPVDLEESADKTTIHDDTTDD